jgi:pimeloyl-ACP methyl ester carboxylesterase
VPTVTSSDGVNLHYEVEGEGPPLLLHLGAAGEAGLWREVGHLGVLSKTHRCILFDHRGHGASDHPAGKDANHIDRFVADIVALLDHLEIASTSFWGWATAVPVGLKAAQDHPTRFDRLVLSGQIAGARGTPEQLAAQSERLVAELTETAWERMIATFDAQERIPVPRWVKERIRATDVEPHQDWWEARPDWNWSPVDALAAVTQPTLFLIGELEDPQGNMTAVAARMPHGQVHRLAGVGNMQGFLQGELVLPVVTAFLAAPAA